MIYLLRKILILSIFILTLPLINNCAGGASTAAPAFKYSTAYNGTRAAGATSGISYKYITPVYAGRAGRTAFSTVFEWGGRFGTVLSGPLAGASYFKF